MGSRSPSVDVGEISQGRGRDTKATRARPDSNGHGINRRSSYSPDSASSAGSPDRDRRRERSRSPFRHGTQANTKQSARDDKHRDSRHNSSRSHDHDRQRDRYSREDRHESSRSSHHKNQDSRSARDNRKRSRSPYRHPGIKKARRDSDDGSHARTPTDRSSLDKTRFVPAGSEELRARHPSTSTSKVRPVDGPTASLVTKHTIIGASASSKPDSQISEPVAKSVSFAASVNKAEEEHDTSQELTLAPQLNDQDAEMERRRKRREAIMAKHRSSTAPLVVRATEQASQLASFASNDDRTSSRATSASPVSSPASPRDLSAPNSPAPLLIHNDEELANRIETSASTPEGDGPSAADYDPMMDMQEDRKHAVDNHQLDKIDHHFGGDTPKTTVEPSAKPASTAEVDMFADDAADDMFAETAEDDMFAPTPVGKITTTTQPKAIATQMDTNLSLVDNWDDPDGYYRSTLQEILDSRYQINANLGRGMFSAVVRAKDLQTTTEVAIKIIRNNETMRKAGAREIEILQKLQEADPRDEKHLVRLIRSFDYRGHLCMVFENLSINLREVLKKFGRSVGINLKAVRQYARQIFLGLSLMRKCNILHADLKPDNILVNEERSKLKICDLGSAGDASENEITPYLVSRFYRAPEIILGTKPDFAMDMWSIGCTLFELYTGKILFAGRSNNQMLKTMMECRGKFSIKQLKKAEFAGAHFEDSGIFRSQERDKVTGKEVIRMLTFVSPSPGRDLKSRLVAASPKGINGEELKELNLFVDLLDKCLQMNPERRISPNEALRHPFISRAKV